MKLCYPRILQNLFCRVSRYRIRLNDFPNQILKRLRWSVFGPVFFPQVIWVLIRSPLYPSVQISFEPSKEWKLTRDHNKEYNAQRPIICCLAQISIVLGQVWVHVLRSTALGIKSFILTAFGWESKINQFDCKDVPFLLYQYVVKLKVSMDDLPRMHVTNSLYNFFEYLRCLLLRQPWIRFSLFQYMV